MRCQSRYDVKDTPRSQSIETVSFKTDETMLIKIWCQSRYGAKCQINTRYTVPIKEMASTKKTDKSRRLSIKKTVNQENCVNPDTVSINIRPCQMKASIKKTVSFKKMV